MIDWKVNTTGEHIQLHIYGHILTNGKLVKEKRTNVKKSKVCIYILKKWDVCQENEGFISRWIWVWDCWGFKQREAFRTSKAGALRVGLKLFILWFVDVSILYFIVWRALCILLFIPEKCIQFILYDIITFVFPYMFSCL